jgi:hypothetical protein
MYMGDGTDKKKVRFAVLRTQQRARGDVDAPWLLIFRRLGMRWVPIHVVSC